MLSLLRLAMSRSANVKTITDLDMKSIDSMRDQAPMLVKYVNELSERNLGCLFKYVNIVKDYALAVANPLGIYLLLEICSISSINVAKFLDQNIDWFKVTCSKYSKIFKYLFKINKFRINVMRLMNKFESIRLSCGH